MKKFKGNTKQIQLTGGEPFTNPHIGEYINKLSENFEIRIPTNGSLLHCYDNSTISKLSLVQFSLYGCNEEEYKLFTGLEYGMKNLIKSIEKVNQCNVDNIATVILSKQNINQMEKYIEVAIKIGLKRIKFGVPTPAGRAGNISQNNNSFSLTIEEMREAYRESKRLKTQYREKISVGIWSHRSSEPKKPLFKDNIFQSLLPCGAGYMSYVISQSGRIRPCELLPKNLFDFGEYRMLDKYVEGQFFTEYKNRLNAYNSNLSRQGISLDCICGPVESLYKSYFKKLV